MGAHLWGGICAFSDSGCFGVHYGRHKELDSEDEEVAAAADDMGAQFIDFMLSTGTCEELSEVQVRGRAAALL